MIFRQAVETDVEVVAKIMGDWCADTSYIPALHSRDEDRAFVAGTIRDHDVMVAEVDSVVQGYIARNDTEISQLYLAPTARGHGVGAALLDCMKSRRDTLNLWCFQANTGARRFYERHGFVAKRFTGGAGNEERLPDIHYVWSIQS